MRQRDRIEGAEMADSSAGLVRDEVVVSGPSVEGSRWAALLPGPATVLGLLLLASLLCRVVWLTIPNTPIVFDETYYVNAARVIDGLSVPNGKPYQGQPAGLDPNREHPPLAKVLIAGTMRLLGNNAFGWRLPSIILGLAAIFFLYLLVQAATGDAWLAILAAALFSFDNLALVHGRIATLDMPLVAFLLLGVWCALRGWPLLAGSALGVATLMKLNGTYGVLAIFLFLAAKAALEWRRARLAGEENDWRADALPVLRTFGLLLAAYLPVWLGGLWLLDLKFSTFHTPWDHVSYMLHYGLGLTRSGGPSGDESYPWQWLINEVQMTYFRVDTEILVNHHVVATRPQVFFRGAMNPIIIGAAPLGLAYSVWRAWRFGDVLSLWVVAWVVATYLPFYPLAMFEHRISYIFYFLPTLPAVAVALAQLLRQGGLPRLVVGGYLLGVLLGFIGYFPYRHLL